MADTLRISLAQCNFHVGDISGNAARIIEVAQQSAREGSDLVVFSELALTGYPPEDLLLRPSQPGLIMKGVLSEKAACQANLFRVQRQIICCGYLRLTPALLNFVAFPE